MRGEDTTMMLFQSTPSARRATEKALRYKLAKWISIHALREEGDDGTLMQSTDPTNFNPRPPRGGRPPKRDVEHGKHHISIHALREEGDLFLFCPGTPALISIHALREEGDLRQSTSRHLREEFQSTPSARRATMSLCEVPT